MAPRIQVIEGGKSALLKGKPAGETALFDEQFVDIGRDSGPSARLARDINVTREAQRAFEAKGRVVAQSLSGHFAWGSVAWFFGVLAATGAVAWAVLAGHLSYWVSVPLESVLIYAIFATLHEATHDNIAGRHSRWQWVNHLIGHISGFVLLAPYPGFRALHLHHHQHTNDPVEDPDYWVKDSSYLRVILRCLAIQPMYIWHLWKIARNPRIMRAFVWEMVYVASYIPIIAGAYYLGFGNALIMLWILPAYFGVCLCPLMFDWPVHHPHTTQDRYAGAAILLFPRPLRPVMEYAFLGHSYHLMHHLYPRIPFYLYSKAYYALEDDVAAVGGKVVDVGLWPTPQGLVDPARIHAHASTH
ncbi:MAG: fatty acid desaturase [Pseudomonadota bacterium]